MQVSGKKLSPQSPEQQTTPAPSLTSPVSFAAFPFSAHFNCYSHSTLVFTKFPPTVCPPVCTSLSGRLSTTQTPSCYLVSITGQNQASPTSLVPSQKLAPPITNCHITTSPLSTHLSPPGPLLLLSWFRPPSFLTWTMTTGTPNACSGGVCGGTLRLPRGGQTGEDNC